MSENINLGLQLLIVGMISVFFILGIVVAIGRLLITLVNYWYADDGPHDTHSHIDKKKIAVISAVVQTVTQGKGRISTINKL